MAKKKPVAKVRAVKRRQPETPDGIQELVAKLLLEKGYLAYDQKKRHDEIDEEVDALNLKLVEIRARNGKE